MKPWIGVTAHIDKGESQDIYPNHPLLYIERHYIEALQSHNMQPILLPPILDRNEIKRYLGKLDGLLLSGGGVLPLKEPSSTLPGLKGTGGERYNNELTLLQEALPLKIPILGVCRGEQMINDVCGGTLKNINGLIEHHQEKQNIPGDIPTHEIKLETSSQLGNILGNKTVQVNSFHRQCIDRLGDGLKVSALSVEDNIIEAIEGEQHPWLIGLQFHPERLWKNDSIWSNLFNNMYEATKLYSHNKK
ncbi:gamma-glutamyl-gamma-aminobutyrate hydrolase family protein [Paenisporosarcina sp. TG-14]|uniref:gamma-glutamyl-gamma-aminobutyrate hydrolase family protein n=1 Tax=Paenisporosarcina sp. TG-14 TaxID=1231057 RepID=UPI00030BA42F|nr:gamma-glutamyl-gamma-aminobutyrate hydrolase family protein [Paenisporosarcina sp. TG-14]